MGDGWIAGEREGCVSGPVHAHRADSSGGWLPTWRRTGRGHGRPHCVSGPERRGARPSRPGVASRVLAAVGVLMMIGAGTEARAEGFFEGLGFLPGGDLSAAAAARLSPLQFGDLALHVFQLALKPVTLPL